MSTPIGGTSAYCTPAQAVVFVAWQIWADLLTTDDDRLASSATVQASPLLAQFLQEGAGMIEFAVLKGGIYTLTDLQAIANQVGGNAAQKLASMNASLSYFTAFVAKNPLCNPEDVTIAKPAFMLLDELSSGAMIFPLAAQVAAGVPAANVVKAWNPPPYKLSTEAYRYFGQRGGIYSGGDSGG